MRKRSDIDQVLRNKGTAISDQQNGDPIQEGAESLQPEVTREDRIRSAAYRAAERRGFVPGHDTEDWLEAERLIDSNPPL